MQWRSLEGLDVPETAEALRYAVEKGWILVREGHSVCHNSGPAIDGPIARPIVKSGRQQQRHRCRRQVQQLDDSQVETWMRDTPDQAAALTKPYAGPIEAWEVSAEVGKPFCWGNRKVCELIDSLYLGQVLTGSYSKGLRRPVFSAMKVSASSSVVKGFTSIAPSAENETRRKG